MTWLDSLQRATSENRLLRRARARAAELTVVALLGAAVWALFVYPFRREDVLLHVAYEGTRDYFEAINVHFSARGSYAGSIRQLDAVARGLVADSICLATAYELDQLVRDGRVAADWREQWPHRASPFATTIVFVVKAGNPKAIRDWADLGRPGVTFAVPSPRVSGAGVHAFLGVVQDARARLGEDPVAIRQAVTAIYLRAHITELGAQQALAAFVRDRSVDAFLTWESEARRLLEAGPARRFEIIYPPRSILAEPVVAMLAAPSARGASERAARAYLDFLFSPEGQQIAAANHLRPRQSPLPSTFPALELRDVESTFGSWSAAWTEHFGENGTYAWIQRLRHARAGGVE